ncbi:MULTISPECIES: type IV toxin-antitoxin system AbiEi family antitoxin domain-containing protein [Variovorax]|uniref:type IV toxin-antitoxin system AbiEi family antitoxin domain-containing protein n=1 Tax=Variovorax TaxID=34072 RepID=UPI0033968306
MLSRLVSAGKLDRVARGVYTLPDRALSEYRSLAEVALRVPRGVVCLLSALRAMASARRRRSKSGSRFLVTRLHTGSTALPWASCACRGRL